MYYFIYCKGPNEKRFTLCNPWKGTRGMGKVYAPRFLKDQADYAVAWMTEHNPGFIFQRRPASPPRKGATNHDNQRTLSLSPA